MASKNVILTKSFEFSLLIIELFKYLTEIKREFILSKQLLRSGTSIGANIEEAQEAQSRADFIHKLSISNKECRESFYWIRLLKIE
jgi:four helix bundle protein